MKCPNIMSCLITHTIKRNTTQTASIGLEFGMCAYHLIELHFTRYCILICRGRSEKGQGISERCDCIVRKEEERERERQ